MSDNPKNSENTAQGTVRDDRHNNFQQKSPMENCFDAADCVESSEKNCFDPADHADPSVSSVSSIEARCDGALRSGLHALPLPTLEADFEDRIHAALAASPPVWHLQLETLLNGLRPALTPALCTLFVTLLLVQLSQLGLKHSAVGAWDSATFTWRPASHHAQNMRAPSSILLQKKKQIRK